MDRAALLPTLRDLAVLQHVHDLGIAYALAFLIGWNRARKDRSAGLRTFPVVGVGACDVAMLTLYLLSRLKPHERG